MDLASISKKIIRYGFLTLFFLVPLIFTSDTSELFELPKMWLTWGLVIVIIGAWITKMIAEREFRVQRTPLDIPLLLFLSSQIISTIFSLDMRISIWGYYSRFNGGLLSTISYILLYYALVSNLSIKTIRHLLYVSLLSGFLVVLWGLPAHFGVDPTCYVVRGSFDISCWTDQFVPTVRIFSTLGQPAWMAAYISFLLPVILAFFLRTLSKDQDANKHTTLSKRLGSLLTSPLAIGYLALSVLFYIALLFANTRAGFLGFVISNFFFWLILLATHFKKYIIPFLMTSVLFLISSYLFGVPIPQLQPYSIGTKVQHAIMRSIGSSLAPASPSGQVANATPSATTDATGQVEIGVANITDSGNIRENVWKGAISAWKANPIFGTGVETYAFAYYRYKPASQNLTSEWDYLYNKAHNEYLNYLATTGLYGLVTYLLFIGWFWYLMIKWFLQEGLQLLHGEENETLIHRFLRNVLHLIRHQPVESTLNPDYAFYIFGLLAGLLTLYISNFFGFSVVIVNLYLFLTPGFVFILQKKLDRSHVFPKTAQVDALNDAPLSTPRMAGIGVVWILCIYLLYLLLRFFSADRAYALGFNLDRSNEYQRAYPSLLQAVNERSHEPVFQDELSYNSAVLAGAYAEQKDTQNSQKLLQQAVTLSDEIASTHPNNIVFMKNRVRMLYELSKIDPQYLAQALQTIQKAYSLAPNDAKIGYNYGVLLGQTGNVQEGIKVLEQMVQIKPDFRDAYFALGLFYRDLATHGGKTILDKEAEQKAESNLRYILSHIDPNDKQVNEQLSTWGVRVQ